MEVLSEELLGDGGNGNYTGAQTRTVDGYSCINWGTNGTDAENYTQAAYPNSNLTENYCRNPYLTGASADTKAATIWCFTSDSEVTWQECQPIGVLRPACRNGFAVPDETVRQILEYAAYTSWVIGALYLFLILCFCSRIREAIAINKVAAIFVAGNPTLLLVPLIQAVLAVLWVGSWVFFASFLLSQVPEDYTPSGTFATYAEAYGTATTPGQCTDKWPTGFTYKDDDNCEIVNGTAQCWRCAQPRYAFDYRFAASFFMPSTSPVVNSSLPVLQQRGSLLPIRRKAEEDLLDRQYGGPYAIIWVRWPLVLSSLPWWHSSDIACSTCKSRLKPRRTA